MTGTILLVDYENVQAVDVSAIPGDVRVHVVLGAKQHTVVAKVEARLSPLGERATVNRIKTLAPNAVDFCIAYYLGEELARRPDTDCVILSKDKKGFDPLVAHLTKERGFRVRRVNAQKDVFPAAKRKKAANAATDSYSRVCKLLTKESNRPLKRKGLMGKLKSYLPEVSMEQRTAIIERLLVEKMVEEEDGKLKFNL